MQQGFFRRPNIVSQRLCLVSLAPKQLRQRQQRHIGLLPCGKVMYSSWRALLIIPSLCGYIYHKLVPPQASLVGIQHHSTCNDCAFWWELVSAPRSDSVFPSVVTATHTPSVNCGQDEMAFHLHLIICTWDAVTTCTPVTIFFPLGVWLCSS